MNTFSRFLRWLMLACLMLGASYALAAKTYSDNNDGTVTDPTTGLTWMRCAVGQTWSEADSNCTGTPTTKTWTEVDAMAGSAAYPGWRLPTIRELLTLVDRTTSKPAIDKVAFPSTPYLNSTWFWSGSPAKVDTKFAWYVDFYYGSVFYADKGVAADSKIVGAVRFVKGNASTDLLNVARPDGIYTDQKDGTVKDNLTNLIWKRCDVWQTWNGSTCAGDTSKLNSVEANKLAVDGWRVPSADELLSLLDFGKYNQAINETIFPNSQGSFFRSSTLVGDIPNSSWFVHFYDGALTGNPPDVAPLDATTNPFKLYSLRLVRGVTTDVPVTLTVDTPTYGAVNSSKLVGINCGPTLPSTLTPKCSNNFTQNTVVTLTATPANLFQSWSADCTVLDSVKHPEICTVTMNAAKKVQANFYPYIPVPEKWSMWGNGKKVVMKVTDYLSNAEVVGSVWTWDVKTGWRFYDPSKTPQDLQTFAAARNWSVLTQINPGEGFWVNAKKAFDMKQPSGSENITASDFKEGNSLALAKNWNLIAVGDEPLPTKFNADIGTIPPGTEPVDNITSLWTWDNSQSKWYFYSPSKEREGTAAVAKFLSDRGYLDATSKKLGANIGFWVLKP